MFVKILDLFPYPITDIPILLYILNVIKVQNFLDVLTICYLTLNRLMALVNEYSYSLNILFGFALNKSPYLYIYP